MVECDGYENDEINEKADKVKNYEEGIPIVKEYETTIKTQKKNMPNITYMQGCVFKRWKISDKCLDLLKGLDVILIPPYILGLT